mmetsp:Transcript_16934/g.36698  ORF Transcript_16934/g.36698 Transcript_16934/m.36698 type:complete len:239 (+) Transcript_16934:233-949(+)
MLSCKGGLPYLRRQLLERLGHRSLRFGRRREGEHQPTAACAAHLGTHRSRGTRRQHEVVELLAAHCQLLAQRVVLVEQPAKRHHITGVQCCLALGGKRRVPREQATEPGLVRLLFGLHVAHHLGGRGSDASRCVDNADGCGELLIREVRRAVRPLEAKHAAVRRRRVVDARRRAMVALLTFVPGSVDLLLAHRARQRRAERAGERYDLRRRRADARDSSQAAAKGDLRSTLLCVDTEV